MSTMAEAVERHLKVVDRCDRCGHQAFVHVELTDGMLLFCGHHYTVNKKILDVLALAIIDETQFINERSPASPASEA